MPYINTIDINGEVYHVANLTDGEHVVNLPLLNNDDTFLLRGDVIDGLTSALVGKPLSANQGKILNEKIDTAITMFQNTVDNISKRMIPIARGISNDGIAYTATGDDLPTVSVAINDEQISAVGKGRQIVFIPYEQNASDAPTLQLNGGEIIPIRLRAPRNQGASDRIPDATQPIWIGALMRGVPYTMTFCGKYWLVDSQITSPSFDNLTRETLQSVANSFIGASGSNKFAVPINKRNGVIGNAMISTTEAENESNSINLVSEGKASEMIRKDITADYAAWTPESGTEKTVENYAKTLPDGKYYIIHGGAVSMDIFTVYGNIKYRFIRQYNDDSCYIELFRGDELTISVEDDASSMTLFGSKMLMDWNIPLPTAADVGKVLTATTVNRAAWTAVINAEEVAF